MGKDLAPEELRICPLLTGGPAGQQNFAILDANTQKSFKKSRAARAKVDMQKDISPTADDLAYLGCDCGKIKMTHSILDFG